MSHLRQSRAPVQTPAGGDQGSRAQSTAAKGGATATQGLDPASLMAAQSTMGNQAVANMISSQQETARPADVTSQQVKPPGSAVESAQEVKPTEKPEEKPEEKPGNEIAQEVEPAEPAAMESDQELKPTEKPEEKIEEKPVNQLEGGFKPPKADTIQSAAEVKQTGEPKKVPGAGKAQKAKPIKKPKNSLMK